MSRLAQGKHRSNNDTRSLHAAIQRERERGAVIKEIACTLYMSATGVGYHLRGECNCEATEAAAVTSRQGKV